MPSASLRWPEVGRGVAAALARLGKVLAAFHAQDFSNLHASLVEKVDAPNPTGPDDLAVSFELSRRVAVGLPFLRGGR